MELRHVNFQQNLGKINSQRLVEMRLESCSGYGDLIKGKFSKRSRLKKKANRPNNKNGANHPSFQTYSNLKCNQYLYIQHLYFVCLSAEFANIIHHRIAGKIKLLQATVSAPAAAANFKHSWPNCNNTPYIHTQTSD